jgi:hypothetical protein
MFRFFLSFIAFTLYLSIFAQSGYWQQEVDYQMTVDFDHTKHQFSGIQKLTYTNHSPDTLNRVFYHLYFNAFQPGSAMDIRSQNVVDPDERIADRISKLSPEEIGYHKIESLKRDGKELKTSTEGTVLIVQLTDPILPGESAVFDMKFKSQVPIQIRRSGRNNSEGVDYTMTQWYPKMAEYDRDGWHTDPYVSREFHGVFGKFDVTVLIDPKYVVAGTGKSTETIENGKKKWHSVASNVHDFAWAADPNFVHATTQVPDGPILHFYHLNDTAINANWKKLEPATVKLFEIMNAKFGLYPFDQFSVIQAGDGGMEYPQCTMISGTGSLGGLISVTVHEAIHNWYYGVLASNELKFPWMDEGFTTYAQNVVLDSLRGKSTYNPHKRSYNSYVGYTTRKDEEPLTTHADHYETNQGYGVAAYSKGCIFLNQLRYIIGDQTFEAAMLHYWAKWKFKHPTPQDFKHVLESASGLELDWYFEAWLGTSTQIDYAIRQVISDGGKTKILIERIGEMPMPLEVEVTTEKGSKTYYIPLGVMRGDKNFGNRKDISINKDWIWAYTYYELNIDESFKSIQNVIIDPMEMTADVDRSQNQFPMATETRILRSE